MAKLKRISDGKVFDCIVYPWYDRMTNRTQLMAAYWDKDTEKWTNQFLTCFAPAVLGIDY